jgi:ABC-type glutathione transport system ATPase component
MVADMGNTSSSTQLLLAVRDLTLHYAQSNIFSSHKRTALVALENVSLDLFAGKTLALVGPSGSGKSSLARCLLLIERPNAGQVLLNGINLLTAQGDALKKLRREIHLIFQDSASALDPHFTVDEILAEPLEIHEPQVTNAARRARIRQVMHQVELPEAWLPRRSHELSGGQRQRVAIARALIVQPQILVLDEALSALDLSAQGQIANLLLNLQRRHALAYLYITHDFAMAAALADQVAVIGAGRILKRGSPAEVFTGNLQPALELCHAAML